MDQVHESDDLKCDIPLPEYIQLYKNGWCGEAEKGSEEHPY
jgi:hypothetical protein